MKKIFSLLNLLVSAVLVLFFFFYSFSGVLQAQTTTCKVESFDVQAEKLSFTVTIKVSSCPKNSFLTLQVVNNTKTTQLQTGSGSLILKGSFDVGGEYTVEAFNTPNSGGARVRLGEQKLKLTGSSTTVKTTSPGVTPKPTPKPTGSTDSSTKPQTENECNTKPILKQGSSGPCVEYIKSILLQKLPEYSQYSEFKSGDSGYSKFGPDTESAVFEWQKLAGIKADGIVGPQTWATLLCKDWDEANKKCKDAQTEKPPADTTPDPGSTQLSAAECERLKRDIAEFGEGEQISSLLSSRCYTPGGFVSKLVSWLLSIAASLAVLFFAFGGVRYMTAAGNPDAAKSAKQIMKWSLFGLVAVLLAYTIVTLVKNITTSTQIL